MTKMQLGQILGSAGLSLLVQPKKVADQKRADKRDKDTRLKSAAASS